ncbi:MAG: hypothetical protein ABI366_01785 [Ginsengibacter sp.]
MKTPGNHPLKIYLSHLLFLAGIISFSCAEAQPITGSWKGKIDHKNVEVKIIKNGDSLTGTSYYYQSPNSYRRYSIKGYFDDRDNSVVWWDDQLIEEKKGNKLLAAKSATPYRSTADFNCPGGTKMYLNGKASLKNDEEQPVRQVDLQKFTEPAFHDEWDFVIDNYSTGANDAVLIDSIGKLAFIKPVSRSTAMVEQESPKPSPRPVTKQPNSQVFIPATPNKPAIKPTPELVKEPIVAAVPLSNEQKFASRSKIVMQEIPVSGDSIELRFYDNAIVDGDSIAIFLNDRLVAEHIRLTEKAYTIKLAVATLQVSNELVMVAENLGSIPPNTSLMVAIVDGKRYETRLESTEQSSAVIRFVRKEP